MCSVATWILKIELDGEWEQCSFNTREEALAAFEALSSDYTINLNKAVLLPPEPALELEGDGELKIKPRQRVN